MKLNSWNQAYIDRVARALGADPEQIVNSMVTAFQVRHQVAEQEGDTDHLLLAFARGDDPQGPLIAGRDLAVLLEAVYRHDKIRDQQRINPQAQEYIAKLEEMLRREVSPEEAARRAAAAPPPLPDGTGSTIEGEEPDKN